MVGRGLSRRAFHPSGSCARRPGETVCDSNWKTLGATSQALMRIVAGGGKILCGLIAEPCGGGCQECTVNFTYNKYRLESENLWRGARWASERSTTAANSSTHGRTPWVFHATSREEMSLAAMIRCHGHVLYISDLLAC